MVSTTLEQVLTKHSSLFRDELVTIEGVTVKLRIDPNAKPHFFRPCSVPYVFRFIFRGLPHVCVYLYDILVTGQSEAAHIQNLTSVLERLESVGIRLKLEKCAFMLPEVEYLDNSITARGLKPMVSKVRAIA